MRPTGGHLPLREASANREAHGQPGLPIERRGRLFATGLPGRAPLRFPADAQRRRELLRLVVRRVSPDVKACETQMFVCVCFVSFRGLNPSSVYFFF